MDDRAHVPSIVPVAKMDTPTGLFRGACSCTWRSDGYQSQAGARRSAEAHADAKNAQRQPLSDRDDPDASTA